MSKEVINRHKPRYVVDFDGLVTYEKDEFAIKDTVFWKTRCLTINRDFLQPAERVRVKINDPKYNFNVVVEALREDIEKYNTEYSYHEEPKLHFPVQLWEVVEGDKDWIAKLDEFALRCVMENL
jgi:hypothetical protein